MKTIYLKNINEAELINDLKTVFPEWDGIGIELPSTGIVHAHYIGRIAEYDAEGNLVYKEGFHANVLAPENFEESVFKSMVVIPANPVHVFGL